MKSKTGKISLYRRGKNGWKTRMIKGKRVKFHITLGEMNRRNNLIRSKALRARTLHGVFELWKYDGEFDDKFFYYPRPDFDVHIRIYTWEAKHTRPNFKKEKGWLIEREAIVSPDEIFAYLSNAFDELYDRIVIGEIRLVIEPQKSQMEKPFRTAKKGRKARI